MTAPALAPRAVDPVAVALSPLAAVVVAVRRLAADPVPVLALVVALLVLPSSGGGEDGGATVRLPDLVLVAFVGLVGLRLLLDGTGLDRLRSALVLPLVGVLLAGGASTLTALDPVASLTGLVRLAEVFVLGPLAVLLALRTARDARRVLVPLVALGLLEGAVGTWQYLTASGAGYAGQSRRAVGTFGAYDIMAMAGVVGYAIVLLVAVACATRGRTQRLAATGAVALLLPLLFSLSRGALLATLVAVGAVLVLSGWRRAVRVGLCAVLLGALALLVAGSAVSTVTERLSTLTSTASTPDQSVQDRYALWSAARTMFAEHPVTGTGIKGFAAYRDSASPLDLSTGSDVSDGAGYRRVALLSPHDFYYLVLSEQGALGALAYAGLFGTLLVRGLSRLRRTPADDVAHRLLGLSAVGLLAFCLTDFVYADIGGGTTVLLAVVVGLGTWWASGARLQERA